MPDIDERSARLNKLQQLGDGAYPARVVRTHTCKAALDEFDAIAEAQSPVSLVGRVRSIRRHGALTFLIVEDGTARIQFLAKKDALSPDENTRLKECFDMGDFVEGTGVLILSKTEEKTLLLSSVRIIAKALAPLPEQWHGLADVETRYRKRELDLLSNPEVRKKFEIRSRFISAIRRFLDNDGFLEVETPILQPIPGGANAQPFITHHNALDTDFYLRIAPELYLKRLLVGGFEKVYEIGRLFRNEGIDHSHSPEFTELELYLAYASDRSLFIRFLEDLLKGAIREATGTLMVTLGDGVIDFSKKWPEQTFREAVLEKTGIDIDSCPSEREIVEAAKKKRLTVDFSKCVGVGECMDELFKKTVRPSLQQPIWISDYPIQLKPLAKASPDDPTKSASVQLLVAGEEIMNAYYHELNDPLEQERRFREQEALRLQGSSDSQYLDRDFLDALEYGMPPASGMGMGIDRIVRILTGSHSLKEVLLFPALRKKDS